MVFIDQPRPETLASLSEATPIPFWLDDPERPEPVAALTYPTTADLLVIGAGFTGLWTALLAKETNRSLDVVLLEGKETATGASGVNGGFVAASLTHGFANGVARWPGEISQLIDLGHENLDAIQASVERLGIDCDFLRTGELTIATERYQVDDLCQGVKQANFFGETLQWLDRDQVRVLVNSPSYLGAIFDPWVAMVNPARLAWGLRRACLQSDVRLFERTPVTRLEYDGKAVTALTPYGSIRAARVALATNAFPPLLKRLSYYIVPVYDYALVSEPLSAEQWESIGWQGRQGVGDAGNQFHYYRTTADGRILWGGYDAIYHWNNGFGPHFESDPTSFGRLAEHFFQTFPQLEGLHFTHTWGGAIDTCSRFSAFWGRAHGGSTAYALGFTGLGVGASRFGAQAMLDLLYNLNTVRTSLKMIHTKPIPFPPEPFRSIGINLTRWSMAKADRNQGRRNLWLRVLDRLGVGFDS
jgi:glycine/D-amino acid oxidase-like deaminating enzyme